MDPVAIEFMQLIGAEIVGAVLVFGGLWLSFRALTSKSHMIVELPGLKAKLKNASPGAVVAAIGLAMIFLSLQSRIVRVEETTTTVPQTQATTPVPQTNPNPSQQDHPAIRPNTTTRTKTEVYMQGPLFQHQVAEVAHTPLQPRG